MIALQWMATVLPRTAGVMERLPLHNASLIYGKIAVGRRVRAANVAAHVDFLRRLTGQGAAMPYVPIQAASSGPSTTLFFVLGLLLWLGLALAAGVYMVRAQLTYVALYQSVHRGEPPTRPKEILRPYTEEPWRWPLGSIKVSSRLWRIVWEPQTDPRLEVARLRVVHRWRFAVALGFLGVLIPVGLSALGN